VPSIGGRVPDFARRSELVERAFAFASVVHADQRRKDGSDFISHPVAVASLVSEAGLDERVVAAAVLHDVVEKSSVDEDEIGSRFGAHVRELVEAMTEDDGIADYEARKVAHREQVEAAGAEAAAIYAADKLANVREMRKLYERDGERIAPLFKAPIDVRVGLWLEDAEMVGRVAPQLPYLPDLRAELDSFQALRRRGGVRAAAGR
jgi:GTP diphosphokinase / guanosine-3',5'-bis(diphosphate) 3'-diphosphatase